MLVPLPCQLARFLQAHSTRQCNSMFVSQMAALCRLTGANVLVVGHDCRYRDWIQQQNAQQRCLLLTSITDWSDAEWTHRFQEGVCSRDYASNMIFRPLDDTTVIESISQGDKSKFAVVRFTWLLDSICAQLIAPMRPYCIGLLVPEATAKKTFAEQVTLRHE